MLCFNVFLMCRLDLNMDLPQAQTTSVGVASQASQEQVSGVDCWYRLRVSIFRLIVSSVVKLNQLKKIIVA